jgi:hypothetical protein
LRVPSLLFLLLLFAAAPGARAASDGTEVVSEANLLASERFWPYHVRLVRDWQPPGSPKPIRKGTIGVLIRVENAGRARVDFSRSGLRDVPIAETDLLENANRIRRGELRKGAPNLVTAIGSRLVDPAVPSPFAPEQMVSNRGFLCVFADPAAESFAALARALSPLRERAGVLTILFPYTKLGDAEVAAALRKLGWEAPFVTTSLSALYGRTLLPDHTPVPAVLLQTGEGALLFSTAWRDDLVPELRAAMDRALGPEPVPSGAVGSAPRGEGD